MQQPQSWVIREEQKDTNPIFKVVFNKIRNLKKKVAQIQHIKTLDYKTLKPAQLEKLKKEEEIAQQINKFDQFAKLYKSILIENHLSYDKADDLIKVSTLLAVGKRVKTCQYCPEEVRKVYEQFYAKIFAENKNEQICKNVPDEVIRVYHILWAYLENESNYSQCRDYISYVQQIDQRMNKSKLETKQAKHKLANQNNNPNLIADLAKKIQKLQVTSQTFKINLDRNICMQSISCQQKIQEIERSLDLDKDLDLKQESSTTNPQGDSERQQLQKEILHIDSHHNSAWCKYKDHAQVDQNDFHSADNKILTNNPNNNRTAKNREKRNRKNKKVNFTQAEFNIRKCSDTSLEPTPEKTWMKRKYMEKKQ